MRQCRGGAGFTVEAFESEAILGLFARQHLNGDAPLQARVFRKENRTHAALADRLQNAVRAQDEAAIAGRQQLPSLEVRQQAGPHQRRRAFACVVG